MNSLLRSGTAVPVDDVSRLGPGQILVCPEYRQDAASTK